MATYYTANRKETLGDYPSALITGGRFKVMHDAITVVTAAGATTALYVFPKLLPGKVVVYPMMSWLRADDADSTADLDLGYSAYVNSAGATVVADLDYWIASADVGAGALQGLWPAITGVTTAGARPTMFDAQDGLEIVVSIDTADINANDVIELVVCYGHIQ